MKQSHLRLAFGVVTAGALVGVGAVAVAAGGGGRLDETLSGYQEVPALSTTGAGEFHATIDDDGNAIHYRLTFGALESDVTQAHIHFENRTNNGAIVVFLCSNLGNGPAGTQACPTAGGTIRGTIRANDVGALAADQGIAAGEFKEFLRAIRAGATYVNVHTTGHQGGEIRAQLD
jgi:CHRD domain